MNNEQKIRMALAYKNISQAKLAEMLGTTSSNLNQKIKKGTLLEKDMENIATALGGVYNTFFEFPDGTKIGGVVAVPKEIPKKPKSKK
jgi:transcriptional regulator with XRE-family HTH domain